MGKGRAASAGPSRRRVTAAASPAPALARYGAVDLVEARLRVRVPKGFAWTTFFQRHPDVVAEALSRYTPDRHHVVVELLIRGDESHDWSAELRATQSIVSVRRLARSGRPNVYRVTWAAPQYYTTLLQRYDLIGSVPFLLSEGHAALSVALSKDRLRALVRELRRRGFAFDIMEMRPFRARVSGGGLTHKQRARFQTAVETGFYDVPRRVTLGELAGRYSVRKSAFAESLALARQKILIAAGRALLNGDDTGRLALFGIR